MSRMHQRAAMHGVLAGGALLMTLPVAALEGGMDLAVGTFPAIGRVNSGCTGTLIDDRRVLTAAHCVCRPGPDKKYSLALCDARARFEFTDVDPPDAAGQRVRRRVDGRVRVHPDFGAAGWLREDLAVIELDRPASQVAPGVAPIDLQDPQWIPGAGTPMRLVGYGLSGANCKGPATKRMLDVTLTSAESARLMIRSPGKRNCPGDSGGPMLDMSGHVAGVMSWTGAEINGRPTHANYNFILGLPRPGWTDCRWVAVGAQRSHQAREAWCPAGSFLTQFDLDGDRGLAAHDAPVVGRARCCRVAGSARRWQSCGWSAVGLQRSEGAGSAWCAPGTYLVAVDLDGERGLTPDRAPIVGQAMCCHPAGGTMSHWGSTVHEPVGGRKSHQAGARWCPGGSFLTAFALVREPGVAAHDNPVVGRATCVRPRP